MDVRGSRKGYGKPKRISFLSGLSFPLRLEPCRPWQLNDMAICAWPEKPFCNWPLIPQPIHRTATARLAVDTTFTLETSISRNLWDTWLDNLCVFSVPRRFVLLYLAQLIQYRQINLSIYLVYLSIYLSICVHLLHSWQAYIGLACYRHEIKCFYCRRALIECASELVCCTI